EYYTNGFNFWTWNSANSSWLNPMTITPTGSVGIGTSTPAGRLDVEGGYTQIGDRGDTWGSMLRMTSGNPTWDVYVGRAWGKLRFFQVVNAGGTAVATDRLVIDNLGNVGIGTPNPGHLLSVAGVVGAREVVVTSTEGADYVFSKDYQLRPLNEVADYVKQNH